MPVTKMPPHKVVKNRSDNAAADYSNGVKKKLAASNRTGQACDRCRIRKMRCDDSPEGCSPCLQNQSECKTTDRINGRATVRGYVQGLERRIQQLEQNNREMEDHLISLGLDIKPSCGYADASSATIQEWNAAPGNATQLHWTNNGNDTTSATNGSSHRSSTDPTVDTPMIHLPSFRGGLAGNNYLGVSSGNSFVSSIRGTSLIVLGMEIDLTDYMSPDLDEPDPSTFLTKPVYNKSYSAFIQTANGGTPRIAKPELPPREEGLIYVQWFFRVINPYLPLLHKPSFISMLTTMYNNEDGHSSGTSVAETVMVHMVFAIMFFQYASRNWEDALQKSELNDLSNRHYHYALSYYSQLVASHTLQDVQALTLICLHLRSFPKPGACWMMTSMTFSLAIDLGLHRSARQWSSTTPKKGMLEIEMRKRIFWSVLTIHVIISGKLGRPMALRFDDFDVEIPEALDDNLLDENGLDTSKPGKCGFLVGLEAFKCQSIFMDLYNNIYTVRRSPRAYIPTVRRLDRLIRQWSEQWPSQLLPESASNDEEGRVHVQYLNIWLLEFRLLLRHPSLSLTGLEDFNHENLAICMEVSGKMLQHVKQIQKYRSLDTNWQTGALYVLAISTTLFGYWENKDELTSAGFATLKADMDAWLSIMGDVGDLLGSGKRLQEVVRVTVDGTLGLLASHLASKTASSALTATASHIDPPAPSAAESHSSNPISYPIPKSNGNEDFEIRAQNTRWSSPEALSAQNHYSDPPFTYPEPPAPNMPQYHPNMTSVPASNPNSFPNASSHANSFQPSSPYSQPHDNPRALATAATTYLFSNPPSITSSFQPPVPAGSAGSTSWRHFAGNMVSSLEPPEYVANALMQLGGHAEQEAGHNSSLNVSTTVPAHGVSGLESSGGLTTGQPWPLMIFESPRT